MRTMKKGLSWLLMLSMILSLFAGLTFAASFDPANTTPEPTPAGSFKFSNGTITGYTGTDKNVVIPAEIDGTTVTMIDQCAFAYDICTDTLISTVVIPSTVTGIGDYAFDYQTGLTDICFYGDVPIMTSDAFGSEDAPSTSDVTVHCKPAYFGKFYSEFNYDVSQDVDKDLEDPKYATNDVTITVNCGAHGSVTANGQTITSAEAGKIKVEKNGSVTLTAVPDEGYEVKSFTVDGENVTLTENAYTLKNVTDKHTVNVTFASTDPIIAAQEGYHFEIRDGKAWIKGFTGSVGADGVITLPTQYKDGDTTYDVVGVVAKAFNYVNGAWGDSAKDNAVISQVKKIIVPMGIKTIETGAFSTMGTVSKDRHVEEIVFNDPDTKFVHTGTDQSFHMSSNPELKSVTLPANLTEITSSMFYGCSALTEMDIPATVTKIGQRAFEGTGLTKLTFTSATPATLEEYTSGRNTTYPFEGCTNLTIYVPAASLADYQTAWAAIANDVTIVGYGEDGETVITSVPDFTVDDIEYRATKFDSATGTGEVEVKYVAKNTGVLTIPETVTKNVNGKEFTFTVTGIGEKAMDQGGYKLSYSSSSYWFTEVNFPSTLTYIREWGCAGLVSVQTIDLSETQITSIGDMAFNGCTNVETIKLPDTLANIGGKGEAVKRDDASIGSDEDVTISGVDAGEESNAKADGPEAAPTQMAENVFRGCGKLKEFIVSDDNPYFKAIDGVLFSKDGTKLIRYPMGKDAATYAIPDGTEVIAEAAFMLPAGINSTSKLTKVTFPKTLKKIEDGAFRQSSLTEVELPNVEYGSYVFDCSKSLTTVTTADGLTAIPEKAFWGCENLKNVTLGASIKTIGKSAFERCGFTGINLTNVTEIGDYAFYFSKLETVDVPAATKTGTGAFMNCPALTKATVNGTTLDPYMFFYCTSLTDLSAPNVTEIGECALAYCVELTALPLDNVTAIGNGAFRNCHGLTDVELPATLKDMGKYVFADCEKLANVTFPNDIAVKVLPEGTFYECVNLKNVDLGNSISMTEGLVFYCAGWYNQGQTLNVYSDLSENLFFRNEFEACFIDLGNQQTANESAASGDDVTYIWTRTAAVDGVKTYYFRARGGAGGCGGGCSGGGEVGEDGLSVNEYSMQPSVNVTYHWGDDDSTENLPELLTIYEQNGKNATAEKVGGFNMVDLKDIAATHAGTATQSLARNIALFSRAAAKVTTGTVGYQFMGMRGPSIMAATEWVTLEELGVELDEGDELLVTSTDGASYSISYEDLMANNQFFPNSYSNGTKTEDGAVTVPAILALTWNSATIDGTAKTDGEVLKDVAATAYRSTNFRFAHGLSFEAYQGLQDCEGGMVEDDVCSGYRLLQKVASFTVVHADGSSDVTPAGGGSGKKADRIENADGSVTTIETRADGSTVETTKYPNGTTIETITSKDGEITAKVNVPMIVKSSVVEVPVSKPSAGMVLVIVNDDGSEEIVRDCVLTKNGLALRAEGTLKLRVIDNTKKFTDMDGHWALDDVTFAAARELFGGVGGGKFAPAQSMTRGMVSTVLARLAGEDTSGSTPWYAKGTAWAAQNGVSDGKNPESPVTREQMATMLYRFAGSPEVSGELSFADAGQVSAWAHDAVLWCVQNGILNGVSGNRLAPQALAQRAQVAAMLQRFLQVTL